MGNKSTLKEQQKIADEYNEKNNIRINVIIEQLKGLTYREAAGILAITKNNIESTLII